MQGAQWGCPSRPQFCMSERPRRDWGRPRPHRPLGAVRWAGPCRVTRLMPQLPVPGGGHHTRPRTFPAPLVGTTTGSREVSKGHQRPAQPCGSRHILGQRSGLPGRRAVFLFLQLIQLFIPGALPSSWHKEEAQSLLTEQINGWRGERGRVGLQRTGDSWCPGDRTSASKGAWGGV